MELLLVSAYVIVFLIIIRFSSFYKIPGISFYFIGGLFLLKVLAGVAMYFIYLKYYKTTESADIFNYFKDSNVLFSAVYDNPGDYLRMLTGWESDSPHLYKYYEQMNFWVKNHNYDLYNDNRTIIRFNALIQLFSFQYFNVHTVFMSFISFTGLIYIYKACIQFFKNKKNELLIVIFLLPSVIFWSSGVLKEGLVFLGLGLFIYSTFNFIQTYQFKFIPGLLLAILILMLSKFYVLFAMLPGVITFFMVRRFPRINMWLSLAIVHILLVTLLFNTKYFSSYDLPQILSQKQHDFVNFINSVDSVGSKIDLPLIEPSTIGIIKNVPNALYNVIIRPTPGDISSIIMWPAFFENIFILLLIIVAIIFPVKKPEKEIFPFLMFCISFSLILFTLIGMTTPVLGAIVRYKIPAFPFFVMIILLFINKEKIIHLLPFKPKSHE
ncbi:MAG: hypothetical protein CVU05_07445 [Bacteroidetes bacterium HGW-Bacteroidetes-21]|jgi:hypothetical protein|nr:MAG: hypothetical protein CVU05_07445 [Bacteroidetes bacterium HGW-Bacteroidetes-21]